jgi:hypothetical protein
LIVVDETIGEERARKRVRVKRKKKNRARAVRRLLIGLVLLLLLLVIGDGAYAYLRLAGSLPAAQEGLEDASDALRQSRVTEARAAIGDAVEEARTAESISDRPSLRLAQHLPWIGNEVETLRAITGAARRSAEAGEAFMGALDAAGARGNDLAGAIYVDGRVDFEIIERAAPSIQEADRLLAEADTLLSDSPVPRFDLLRDALLSARRKVGAASASAHKAEALTRSLPDLLGAEGVKKYFLAFQTPSEARGGGGLIGLYGILEARNGKLELGRVRYIGDLIERFPAVDAPPWFRQRYGSLQALRQWQQANFSPHFPAVSEVLLKMYEEVKATQLDGVLAMDPFALQSLTEATGPIVTPAFGALGPQNAAEALLYDSYVMFESEVEQSAALGTVVSELWSRLSSGQAETEPLVDSLGQAVREQHLKIYARDAALQESLEEAEVHGWISEAEGLPQMIFHGNYTASKIDYFLERNQRTSVVLDNDGLAKITTTITLDNQAPRGGRNPILFGRRELKGYPAGLNGMFLNFLLPEEADVQDVRIDGKRAEYLFDQEAGYPVAWDLVEIPAGESATATVTYLVPAVDLDAESPTFDMTLVPQALVTPDRYSIRVDPPPGYRTESLSHHRDILPGLSFETRGTLDEKQTFSLLIEAL